jgi:SAM-dependent methyltransferase
MHYSSCPLCGSTAISEVLRVKDQTVSGETFGIWHCAGCSVRFTQDVPGEEAIGRYYQSADYISHSDTQKGLVNWLYHRVRQYTLGQKHKLVQRTTGLSQGRLLDIGCGTGAFLHTMQTMGWQVTGVEPDAGARARAKQLYGIDPYEATALFSLPNEAYDAITLWHVMEHVHQQQNYVQTLLRLLAPGGKLVIAVPNYTALDGKLYREYWAAYDVPRHLFHYSPAAMTTFMEKNGFVRERLYPMWFDSFYIALLSEKYRSGKTRLFKAVWNGFRSNLAAWRDPARCSSVIYVFRKKATEQP